MVEAPANGILAKLCYPEGSVVAVTHVIAYITAPGESVADLPTHTAPASLAPSPERAAPLPVVSAAAALAHAGGPVRAMPVARKLAKEHGLDLADLAGSGPNGAITKEDVERAVAARAAAAAPPIQRIGFFSEGHRLDGLLYTPRGLKAGERRPGVVLLVGYTYLKTMVLPDIARVLNAAGYVALLFDYRGFGDSEGPRGRLIAILHRS